MITIKTLFFGVAHDLTGISEERTEVPEGESLAELWRRYQDRFPRLAQLRDSLLFSVNQAVAEPSHQLEDGDEVAFLPPVSGGEEQAACRITRDVISSSSLAASLCAPEDGAVVAFEGVVRNHSRGRKVVCLEYEAYEPMALRIMDEIRDEARRKFPVDCVAAVHRVGRLEIGAASVAIVVTARHRAAAFESCRYVIDELKQRVPIWKKEFFEDGSAWAEGVWHEAVLAEAKK
ncbi:MAG: molybdenum cofactor biosynthesis protein MoaE [Terriglobia bacterium]